VSDDATPRFRLDAVALSLYLSLAAVAGAVVGHHPWVGRPHPAGAAADEVAALVVQPLGVAVGGFLAGGVAIVTGYVGRRRWPTLVARAAGWTLLTLVTAAVADRFAEPPASPFGPGGSVGAVAAATLADRLKPPLPAILLAAAAFAGVALALPGVVRTLGVGLARGNGCVAGLTNRLLTRRPTAPPPVLVPVVTAPAPPAAEPPPPPPPPISRPAPPAVTPPPPLRLHVPDEPAPIPHPELRIPNSADGYVLPPLDLLADPEAFAAADHEQKLRERAALLEKTFADFGVTVRVVGIHTGPVITQYEIALDTGLRLSKVTTLADDLALCLGVPAVRIVAPLPGRTTVGIEVPNDHRQTVRLKELIQATAGKAAKFKLPIFLGKDVEGRPLAYDMAAMPHLLIAGRTGTGKSVCLNSVILSFLFTRSPDDCRLILIDPKKVELSEYGQVPHLMHPVVTDDKKAEAILSWAVDKMEERYELLRRARVRNIHSFNDLGRDEAIRRVNPETEEERAAIPTRLPYIVIVVDEVGDLIMSMRKEVEGHIIRLAQKSRAAGIHLILATQKPTVDVITGLIKSNLPARICFQVASRADSAVVLDEKGADKLLGMGDMLFLQPGTSTIVRAQGAYVDDREIERVVAELAQYEPCYETELLTLKAKDDRGDGAGGEFGDRLRVRDPLYEQAIDIVVREQRGSTSLLQRALGIGYGRASRLIDFMAEDGLVGGFNGSSARDVLVTPDEWQDKKQGA
jgi:S-DNA-T family DNA segregation ATPase FtsK/SpoIIIE